MTRWYACPGCHEVVSWLAEIRYAIGLSDVAPRWRCAACIEELETLAAQYAAGNAFSADQCVWALEVVRERGQRTAVASA